MNIKIMRVRFNKNAKITSTTRKKSNKIKQETKNKTITKNKQ